jgi:hypothetical protein
MAAIVGFAETKFFNFSEVFMASAGGPTKSPIVVAVDAKVLSGIIRLE